MNNLNDWLKSKCELENLKYQPVKWQSICRNGKIGIGAAMHGIAKLNNMTPDEFIKRIIKEDGAPSD